MQKFASSTTPRGAPTYRWHTTPANNVRMGLATVAALVSVVATVFGGEASALSPAVEVTPTVEAPLMPTKPNYLEVWVDSTDPTHLDAVVSKLAELRAGPSGSMAVPVVAMYHVGTYKNLTTEVRARLHRIGVKVYAQSAVPSDLPVTTSPAWVLLTPTGRHIVEGTLAIDNFLGADGEFVDGSKTAVSGPARPAQGNSTMEGF